MYHVTFLDQLLILLKGKCEFCGHLKLHPLEISRFACKLRLIHHGMLKESQQLDDLLSAASSQSALITNGTAMEDDEVESESDTDDFKERMKAFTRHVINAHLKCQSSSVVEKTEAIAEERRKIIKGFLAAIRRPTSCGQCKGYV